MDGLFDELLAKYQGPVMAFIYRYVGNICDADDLTQEVFISVFKNLCKLKEREKAKSWIFSIAANKSRNFIRWKKIRNFLSLETRVHEDEGLKLEDIIDSKEESPQKVLEREEKIKLVLSALAPREKEIMLFRMQGFEIKEIAGLLNLAEGTVKAHISFARGKIGEMLGEL